MKLLESFQSLVSSHTLLLGFVILASVLGVGKQRAEKAFLPLWVPTTGSVPQVNILMVGEGEQIL